MKKSAFPYQSCRDPLAALRQRLRELAQTRVRFGYRRLLVLLRREGWELGKKRCYRLHTEEGLTLCRKRPWRHATRECLAIDVGRGLSGQDVVARSECGNRSDRDHPVGIDTFLMRERHETS